MLTSDPSSLSDVECLLHRRFKKFADRFVTCKRLCSVKRHLIKKELTIEELIDKEHSQLKATNLAEFNSCKNLLMLDYTVDAMLFALAVYKCSLKHHFFLKYDL